jgi:hypothetical protein
MKDVGKLYGHLVNFMAVWYILWPFGIFSPILYLENLATLFHKTWRESLDKYVVFLLKR